MSRGLDRSRAKLTYRGLRVAIPSWAISLVVHVSVLLLFTTLSWSVAKAIPDREFSVGIMVRKQTSEGDVFQDRENVYDSQPGRTSDLEYIPQEVSQNLLPAIPQPSAELLGLEGMVQGVSDMVNIPPSADVAGAADSTVFWGVAAAGNRFVYVIDRSGSMATRNALALAIEELISSLNMLQPTSEFQIIMYNTEPVLMPSAGRSHLVKATQQSKAAAIDFLRTMVAMGGTDHFLALQAALELNPDVIYFLTDAADLTLNDVERVQQLNRQHATIHVIEFDSESGGAPGSPLRRLSDSNGGTYRFVPVRGQPDN